VGSSKKPFTDGACDIDLSLFAALKHVFSFRACAVRYMRYS
jgi:hypothetical protein